ncbi:MAG: phosphatidylserine decarboxylase family protein [candidate division Zixibacteria bacterium]|nr:phosphatidylserine decarboxylase family protein [candidate division Zixibacteria bacterium]
MIAVNGLKFILPAMALTIILALWSAGKDSLPILIIAGLGAILALFLTFFYRNPLRNIPTEGGLILSIADGRVLSVEDIDNDYIGGRGKKVSIFLSVFDVHINRVPVSGRVDYVKYNPGKFWAAFKAEASKENEQTEIGLAFEHGRLIYKQIVGVLARRIVCHLQKDQTVNAGEIFGMIHFGSRAELYLPDNVEVTTKVGDRVKAGESIIGRIRD